MSSVGPGPVVFVTQGRRVHVVCIMLALGRIGHAGLDNMVARGCDPNGSSVSRVVCHGY